MPFIDRSKIGHFLLYCTLVAVLIFEGFAFLVTGVWDMFLHSKDQVLSALLRIVVGPMNFAALVAVLRKPYRSAWRSSQPVTLPSLPQPAGKGSPFFMPIVLFVQAASLPLVFIPIWIELRSPIHGKWDIAILIAAAVLFAYGAILLAHALIYGAVSFGWVAVGSLLPLLGVVQFLYLTFYVPTHNRPSVDVTAKLKKMDHSQGVTHMRGTISVKNRGSSTVGVLGSMYAVTGARADMPRSGLVPRGLLDANKEDRSHFGKYASLLRADDILPIGKDLSGGENWSTSFVFDARDAQQDLIRLTAYLSLVTHAGHLEDIKCNMDSSPGVCEVPFHGRSLARKYLGDEPNARTDLHYAAKSSPYIETRFYAQGEKNDYAEAVDFLTRNQFTQTIAEYRLDP